MASKQQLKIESAIKDRFPSLKVLTDCRGFEKLKNDKTGNRYEVDIYLPQFSVGFEFQGQYHFKEIKGKYNDPDRSRKNDVIKYEMAKDHNTLSIVEVFETDLNGDIISNLCYRIENTISAYQGKHKKCRNMGLLATYFKNGIDYHWVKPNWQMNKIQFKWSTSKKYFLDSLYPMYSKKANP